jgi:hypothetical protein
MSMKEHQIIAEMQDSAYRAKSFEQKFIQTSKFLQQRDTELLDLRAECH